MKKKKSSKHGTKEWAEKSSFNILTGCQHDCLYCFARERLVNTKQVKTVNWSKPKLRTRDFFKNPREKKIDVMYPSSHDIHPDNLYAHLFKLDKLVKAFAKVIIVMKPHRECVEAICWNFRNYKEKILFRFTIGSVNSAVLGYWEPNAPSYEERVECLKMARDAGFQTSVSAEPLLDDRPYHLVRNLSKLVTETIWIGRMNRGINCLKAAKMWTSNVEIAYTRLMEQHSDENFIRFYEHLKGNKKIRWKDTVRKVIEKHVGGKIDYSECRIHDGK
jgi:DNA repair photolyase